MSDFAQQVDAVGKRPGDPIGPAPGSVAAHNMAYHGLRVKEYNLWSSLMCHGDDEFDCPISQWPESLNEYVDRECGRLGMCGEVIATAVAEWIKAVPAARNTTLEPTQ